MGLFIFLYEENLNGIFVYGFFIVIIWYFVKRFFLLKGYFKF